MLWKIDFLLPPKKTNPPFFSLQRSSLTRILFDTSDEILKESRQWTALVFWKRSRWRFELNRRNKWTRLNGAAMHKGTRGLFLFCKCIWEAEEFNGIMLHMRREWLAAKVETRDCFSLGCSGNLKQLGEGRLLRNDFGLSVFASPRMIRR